MTGKDLGEGSSSELDPQRQPPTSSDGYALGTFAALQKTTEAEAQSEPGREVRKGLGRQVGARSSCRAF